MKVAKTSWEAAGALIQLFRSSKGEKTVNKGGDNKNA